MKSGSFTLVENQAGEAAAHRLDMALTQLIKFSYYMNNEYDWFGGFNEKENCVHIIFSIIVVFL